MVAFHHFVHYDAYVTSDSDAPETIVASRYALKVHSFVQHIHAASADNVASSFNPLPHGDANRHTIFKRKN